VVLQLTALRRFVKWRAALMELSIRKLELGNAKTPISGTGPDPYQMTQVHDYLNISFLRMNPDVKVASKEVIKVFSLNYPELLGRKYFVNVPYLMGWVYTLMKVFLPKDTASKLEMLSNGSSLAGAIKATHPWAKDLPVAYGGEGDAKERTLELVANA
jgi:phosphatidylinositol transfer protein SFH5